MEPMEPMVIKVDRDDMRAALNAASLSTARNDLTRPTLCHVLIRKIGEDKVQVVGADGFTLTQADVECRWVGGPDEVMVWWQDAADMLKGRKDRWDNTVKILGRPRASRPSADVPDRDREPAPDDIAKRPLPGVFPDYSHIVSSIPPEQAVVMVEREALAMACESFKAVGEANTVLHIDGDGVFVTSAVFGGKFNYSHGTEFQVRLESKDWNKATSLVGIDMRFIGRAVKHSRTDLVSLHVPVYLPTERACERPMMVKTDCWQSVLMPRHVGFDAGPLPKCWQPAKRDETEANLATALRHPYTDGDGLTLIRKAAEWISTAYTSPDGSDLVKDLNLLALRLHARLPERS